LYNYIVYFIRIICSQEKVELWLYYIGPFACRHEHMRV